MQEYINDLRVCVTTYCHSRVVRDNFENTTLYTQKCSQVCHIYTLRKKVTPCTFSKSGGTARTLATKSEVGSRARQKSAFFIMCDWRGFCFWTLLVLWRLYGSHFTTLSLPNAWLWLCSCMKNWLLLTLPSWTRYPLRFSACVVNRYSRAIMRLSLKLNRCEMWPFRIHKPTKGACCVWMLVHFGTVEQPREVVHVVLRYAMRTWSTKCKFEPRTRT